MKITISMVLDQLNDYDYECFLSTRDQKPGFSSVRLVNSAPQSFKPDVLYLSSVSLLHDKNISQWPENLICIDDSDESLETDRFKAVDLAVVKKVDEPAVLLEKIQDIISEYLGIREEMIRLIAENKGLTVMVNRMTQVIGNPIYVADSDFKILALATCPMNNPDAWKNIAENGIENGYISSSVNDFYYMKDLIHKMGDQNKPVLFQGNAFYPDSFCTMNIKHRNKNIGLVSAFETEKPFTQGTMDLLEFFSDFLLLEIQKNQAIIINEGVKLGHLFGEILGENFNSENELRKVINYLDFTFPDDFFIMVIKSNLSRENTYELSFLRKKIIGIVQNSICIIYQNSIVMLANDKGEKQLQDQRLLELEKWLTESKMAVGISKDCSEITEIKKAYREAGTALEIGKKTEKDGLMYFYNRFRFLHLMDLISNLENSEDLCHPSLKKLMLHDEKKGSNLTETLYCYMKNGRSQAQTAKELHMHRSSLQYRLIKMEEVMGIELDHYQTFLHLQLTYEIMRQRNRNDVD